MTRILAHARRHSVAFIALFVALGGSGYASWSIPSNSVGARQIKNHSITPVKFDPTAIGGTIRYWARIDATGKVLASRPRATTIGWSSVNHSGRINWGRAIPNGCFSLATVDSVTSQGFASVATLNQSRPPAFVVVATFNTNGQPTGEPVNVMVVCP
jgi:hypothetical protein